jgi:hypothetical protein
MRPEALAQQSALGRNGSLWDSLSQHNPHCGFPYRCPLIRILTMTVATLTMASAMHGKNFARFSRQIGAILKRGAWLDHY